MNTDNRNRYTIGLQTGIDLYTEVVRTYRQGVIETVDVPDMEMIEDTQVIKTVDVPDMEMICVISEAE